MLVPGLDEDKHNSYTVPSPIDRVRARVGPGVISWGMPSWSAEPWLGQAMQSRRCQPAVTREYVTGATGTSKGVEHGDDN